MGIVEQVYEALQDTLSHPQVVTVEDLVNVGCSYRHHLRLTGQPASKPESGKDIIVRESSKGVRAMIRRYLIQAFPDRFERVPVRTVGGSVVVNAVGKLDGMLVEVAPVSTKVFANKAPPKKVRIATAAKAYLSGCDEAWLILIDRDKQDWSSWRIYGDLRSIGSMVEQDAKFIAGLSGGSSQHVGTASDRTCANCPYKTTCEAQRVGDPDPWEETLSYRLDNGLTKELDAFLWRRNALDEGHVKSRISPSHFSTTECDRAVAYGLMGTEEKTHIDAKLRRIFDTGHAFHDVVQAALFWMFDDFEEEVFMQMPQYRMKGSCDGVLQKVRDGFEIKSIGSNGYKKLTKAKKEHVKQATMYGIGLVLTAIEYLYVCKETGEIRAFRQPPDKKQWHKLAGRASRIIKAVDAHVEHGDDLPPQIDKEYACKKCSFGWKCKPELFRSRSQSFGRGGRRRIRR